MPKNEALSCIEDVYNSNNVTRVMSLPMPRINPKVAVLKFKYSATPLYHPEMKKNCFKYIADIGE